VGQREHPKWRLVAWGSVKGFNTDIMSEKAWNDRMRNKMVMEPEMILGFFLGQPRRN